MAAKILADAVLRSGRENGHPEFGVERRGAPVMAYARIAESHIFLRSRIYEPDVVVVLDPMLGGDREVLKGLKPGGTLMLNSDLPQSELSDRWPGPRVIGVPATKIALAHRLGSPSSPVVNTAMCGALSAVFSLADLPSLEAAVRDAVPVKRDENAAASRQAFELFSGKVHAEA